MCSNDNQPQRPTVSTGPGKGTAGSPGTGGARRRKARTVADLFEHMITVQQPTPARAAMTRSVCRLSIAPFFAHRPADTVTPADVQRWLRWLTGDRGLAANTARQHFRVLSTACQQAVESRLLAVNPCARGVRMPPVARPVVPPPRHREPIGSGSAGTATGHSRAHTPTRRLADAIADGIQDLRPLFQAPDAD